LFAASEPIVLIATDGIKRRRPREFKLNTLLEITKAINQNLPDRKLYVLFSDILENDLKIGKAIMFMKRDGRWVKVLEYGATEDEQNTDVEQRLNHVDDITVVTMEGINDTTSFDVVIPVFNDSKVIAYLLMGDHDEQERKASPIIKHLPFVQTLANITAVAVENQRLIRAGLERERMNRELEMAREMQSMLFPKMLPDDHVIQIAAEYLPHQQVGGDYYDIIQNGDEVFICLADVSGKGISAAILMANFQANLRAIVNFESDMRVIIEELNDRVWNSAAGEKFITMFLARYNVKTKVLDYVNAAHPAPLLLQDNHEFHLQEGCVGLGMFDEMPFINQGEIRIKPNSTLMCFTDGISELEDADGRIFGEEALFSIMKQNTKEPVDVLGRQVIEALNDFAGWDRFHDDIALVTCRFF